MWRFLSVETTAFTFWDYPLSYIELAGTIFYLWSVWLIARRHILTWPIGIISVLLYLALFYQIRLYGDAAEQIYYLIASVYGWWRWSRAAHAKDGVLTVRYSASSAIMAGVLVTVALSVAAGVLLTRVHLWLPRWFPEAASFPYLDALTTVMSFTAMALMAQRRIESWVYWIMVDVIGIGLYYVKEMRFIALLYVVLLVMAVNGLVAWRRTITYRADC